LGSFVSEIKNLRLSTINIVMFRITIISLTVACLGYIDNKNLAIISNAILSRYGDQIIVVKQIANPLIRLLIEVNYGLGIFGILLFGSLKNFSYYIPFFLSIEKLFRVVSNVVGYYILLSYFIVTIAVASSIIANDFSLFEQVLYFPICLVTILPFILTGLTFVLKDNGTKEI